VTARRLGIACLVIAIAICSAMALGRFQLFEFSEPKIDRVKLRLMRLEGSISQFQLSMHFLPRTLQDLLSPNGLDRWGGPYARDDEILDVWGNPVVYDILDAKAQKFRLRVTDPRGGKGASIVHEP
jgi:type II secretory pathway pseudopilin PulG